MLAAVVCSILVGGESLATICGSWSGAVHYRGTPWEMSVHVPASDSEPVLLDLPELLYYEEPVKATYEDTWIEMELPFGLGTVRLEERGDTLSGSAPLGQGRFEVLLQRSADDRRTERREVTVPTSSGELAGALYLPSGEGPFPAVVVVHGSGSSDRTRWEYRSQGIYYARHGFAALVYDKQDPEADLSVLSEDAESCFDFLGRQPDVDSTKVGMTGGSQAAWLIAMAARECRPAFIHLNSAPAETPREVEYDATALRVRARGGDDAAESYAMTYLGLYFASAMTGRHIESVQAEADRFPDEEWVEVLPIPAGYEELQWWRRNADFGTGQLWSGIHCPVLLLYGENDTAVPPLKSGAIIAGKLRLAGNGNVTHKLFENADHRLEVGGDIVHGRWRWPRMADGYFSTVESWLATRAVTGQSK